jgi:peptidoglycan/xylan/chitin deacetylase (PgdA/CDA1 family)
LPGLSPSELEEEVLGSRERLRRATGRAPAAFAYPFGDVDAPSAAAARGAFACAVTTRFALLGDQPDPHLLPRIDAYYLRSGDRLQSFGRPGFRRWLAARGVVRRAGVIARRLVPTPKLGKHAGAPTMDSQVEDEEPERGA